MAPLECEQNGYNTFVLGARWTQVLLLAIRIFQRISFGDGEGNQLFQYDCTQTGTSRAAK